MITNISPIKRRPLKRNKNIQTSSCEHHPGLLFCWKIRTGIKNAVDPERVVAFFNFFWNNHLKRHFAEEEELLFLKVADSMCIKVLNRHEEIRSLLKDLTGSSRKLTEITKCIETHIRFEESELFPHLEEILTDEELMIIGSALEESHITPFNDNYPDEFWKN